MSNPHSLTRVSIDLGVRVENPVFDNNKPKTIRNHPPRLQHSPSLPNIWFPPHSGPMPPQLEDAHHEQRSASPPPITEEPSLKPSVSRRKPMEHRETLSFDDVSSYLNIQPVKIQRRRRIDRDSGHPLITPPLTPSSSLRTATSISSSNHPETSNDSKADSIEELDPSATHFLLLSNVSKTIPPDTLRTAIVSSLTSPHVSTSSDVASTLSVPKAVPRLGFLSDDSIKGVFVRCQRSHGMVMLAFFDIRHAAVAKNLLSTPLAGPLAECVGNEVTEEGSRISCRFVTSEELGETIGNSPFLASVDGSFYLSVEGKELPPGVDMAELRIADDRDIADDETSGNNSAEFQDVDETLSPENKKHNINITMLKSMLVSFGVLKSFSAVDLITNTRESQGKAFHLEYYDVREANAAYTALNGQVLFGMKLRVFGRDSTVEQNNHSPETPQQRQSSPPNSPLINVIPFPGTLATNAYTGEPTLQIGPPGHHSQIRERFAYPVPPRSRPRSVSAGHHIHSAPFTQSPAFISSLHNGAPSPTYFYTSTPIEHDNVTPYPYDRASRRAPAQYFIDATGRPYPPQGRPGLRDSTDQNHPPTFKPDSIPEGNNAPQEGEHGVQHDSGLLTYSTHQDCYYCPSQGTPGGHSNYYASYSTQHSSFYSSMHPNVHFPISPPPLTPLIPVRGYAYDVQNPQPTGPPAVANWTYDHTMMGTSRSPGPEVWFPESNGMVLQGLQNTSYYPQLPLPQAGFIPPGHPPVVKQEISEQLLQAAPDIYRTNAPNRPSPRSSRSNHLNITREPPVPPERNQLNLARIEDGQDTRTTVMVKNIPNKMSDKDLIAYIGNVCPRKIDFLYLRMDFQNGCNVGYAFVNFIKVQDLLFFAKKKLGEKWNMFSSEKVLQMSYANYQGKEALVEKFKNSCIMDEREAWRPKIFYSEPGPEQGLPEPFPAPTHIRRKERSSYNRGALYVPGATRGATPQHSQALSGDQHDEEPRSHHGRYADRNVPDVEDGQAYPAVAARRRSIPKAWGASGV